MDDNPKSNYRSKKKNLLIMVKRKSWNSLKGKTYRQMHSSFVVLLHVAVLNAPEFQEYLLHLSNSNHLEATITSM